MLEAFYQQIVDSASVKKKKKKWYHNFPFTAKYQKNHNNSLYIWGGVGKGKTYLMDLFYDSLPIESKRRIHFHHFMQEIHQSLSQLVGIKNPLNNVAKALALESRIICLDEFFVTDIGDAMLLSELLEQLLQYGVILVLTSNVPPYQLYENGLQRTRFLPAIDLIESYFDVHMLDSAMDYRLRILSQEPLYHYPITPESEMVMRSHFMDLSMHHADERPESSQWINGHEFSYIECAGPVVWLDFDELCNKPRSVRDYIELARLYGVVMVSKVPQFTAERDDAARRFIHMVDEFYDCGVKLIISAQVGVDDIYQGVVLRFLFERTQSRLIEMQSSAYLSKDHEG